MTIFCQKREKISEAVRKAYGIQNRMGITSHVEHIKHKLNLLEREYEVVPDNLAQERSSFESPRSKMQVKVIRGCMPLIQLDDSES